MKKGGALCRSEIEQDEQTLKDWFKSHLPDTPLGIVGPSEYSGWIEGGPRYFKADFDAVGLALFKAAWPEHSPWSVDVWPLSRWKQRLD